MTVTERLIGLASEVADNAGAAELDYARLCLLDWLGVTIAGAHEPVTEVLVAACDTLGGGHPLFGRTETASLQDAVLINGAAGHALDYDDGMPGMNGHPSVAILPSLVLLAARRGIDGERLLRAIVAGVEAAGRIGLMLGDDHYARGFHATGTVGAMAGAVAAAYLECLPQDQSCATLGLAATRAAGLKASFGSDAKPLHAAWAAEIALTSLIWASKGMTGPSDILGHGQGISALTGSFDAEAGLEPPVGALIHTVNFKYYAACAVTHPAIDLSLALQRRCAERVEAVRLEVAQAADSICNIAAPASGLELKFSLRGVTAMALAGIDTSNPGSFEVGVLANPEVRRIMDCVEVVLDPTLAIGQTRVEVGFADGSSAQGYGSLEDFEREAGILRDRLGKKFHALAEVAAGEATARALATEILGVPAPKAARIAELLTRSNDDT